LPDQQKRHEKLAVIKGSVPALNQTFTGCRFVQRCDMAREACSRQVPQWHQIDLQQGVRCLLYAQQQRLAPVFPTPTSKHRPYAAKPTESLLLVDDLKVHFPIQKGVFRRVVGHIKAVDGISLTIPKGHTLALVGESGCGKTTVGKAILQLPRPTAGTVSFAGDELTQLKGKALRQRRSDMQIIFQDPQSSMNPRMLVSNIVAEGMQAQRLYSKSQRRQRVEELLTHVGLPASAASRYPHEFSGGQRQRICIARALAVEPRLIVCDEPTSALDVSVQAQILNLLKGLQHELDLSYLFITHNISVVAYLADEVAVMYLGRIVEQGRVDAVLERPAHPYTQALMSAVPVADPAHQRQVIQLAGDMPSPATPPSGCHFHPRCPQASDQCRKAYPKQTELGPDHWASCWLLS
jgi:peptide/nickel transport system ATP-binding protein